MAIGLAGHRRTESDAAMAFPMHAYEYDMALVTVELEL